MSKHIHLNLIKEEELVSSCPIRAQIIAPVIAGIITISTLIWWSFLYVNFAGLKSLNIKHFNINKELEPGYQAVLALNKEEAELGALIAQLKAFQNSKLYYSDVLTGIPELVQPNIQFLKMEIPPPGPPLFETGKEFQGPTNIFESANILITGVTSGTKAFDSVDQLIQSLKSNAFTNLIKTAQVPKGSFRQDTKSDKGGQSLRFELKCECRERSFQ